jgi:hypothetical protein
MQVRSLPLQLPLKAPLPKQMKLVVNPTRTPEMWVFDHEHNNTVDEGLTNGTEVAIDYWHYLLTGEDPKVGSRIQFTLDTEPFQEAITTLVLQSTDDHGSTYLDTLTDKVVWLCPWLQGFFGYVPDTVYISPRAHGNVV